MLSTTIKRTMATTLSGAALAGTLGVPAASAMPVDPVGAPGEPSGALIVPAAAQTAPDPGFDVSSAAIGAAAGTGVLLVVIAAGGLAWRRPETRGHGAAGA